MLQGWGVEESELADAVGAKAVKQTFGEDSPTGLLLACP